MVIEGSRDFNMINNIHLPELKCDYLLTLNNIVSKDQKYIKCKT